MSDFNFEALNQGAVAVPNAVNESIDKWAQLNQNAKVADAMVRANPDLEQRMGMPEGAFSTLSAQDKIAATTGYIKNQGVQEFQARMADYTAQANQRQQTVQDDQTAGAFLQHYLAAPDTTTNDDGSTRPTTPQERMSAAATATPGMSGRILPKVMDSLSKWQTAQEPTDEKLPTSYSEDPTTGARFVTRGKQILPSGYDPKMLDKGPIKSEDGRAIFDGKKWVQLKELGYPEGSTIEVEAGVNVVKGPDGRILKTIGTQSEGQALASVLNPTPTPPAPKTLDRSTAEQYLMKAGGDKVKARAAATKDGYSY